MTTIPRNKGSYSLRKSGRYQIRYPLGWSDAKKKYDDYREETDSEPEAIALLKQINDYVYHGGVASDVPAWRKAQKEGAVDKGKTLDEFAAAFMDLRKKRGELAERTLSSDKSCYQRVSPYLGSKPLREITPFDIECAYANMKSGGRSNLNGRAYSGTTVQKSHAFLNQIMERALDYGIIDKNPCDKVKSTKRDTPEKQALDALGARALYRFITSEDLTPRSVGVLIGLFCGLRLSEMLALQWSDYNGGVISVTKSLVKDKQEFKSTKNEDTRDVPCPAALIAVLEEWKGLQRDWYSDNELRWSRSAPIVQSKVGNHILQRSYGRWFESARLRYPIPNDFGYHCLRHTYVTLMVTDVKTDEETARSLSGHRAMQSLQTYVHTDSAHLKQAVKSYGELVAPSGGLACCANCKRWTPSPDDYAKGACWANDSKIDVTYASNKCDKGKFMRGMGDVTP